MSGSGVPRGARWSMFLRSFIVQGSWNYHTMMGGGFAFALLPVLRRLHGDGEELEEALARHVEHFNVHPYLAGLALGAVARLETEGCDPSLLGRFKVAIKGPLGGLGDNLVWAAWLPTTVLLGLLLWAMGAPPWVAVVVFLGLYNLGHLGLRLWGFEVGLREGTEVAGRLREAGLGRHAERIIRTGCVALGLLSGELLVRMAGLGALPGFWSILAALAFLLGLAAGLRAWRPAALAVVGVVVGITLVGLVA